MYWTFAWIKWWATGETPFAIFDRVSVCVCVCASDRSAQPSSAMQRLLVSAFRDHPKSNSGCIHSGAYYYGIETPQRRLCCCWRSRAINSSERSLVHKCVHEYMCTCERINCFEHLKVEQVNTEINWLATNQINKKKCVTRITPKHVTIFRSAKSPTERVRGFWQFCNKYPNIRCSFGRNRYHWHVTIDR